MCQEKNTKIIVSPREDGGGYVAFVEGNCHFRVAGRTPNEAIGGLVVMKGAELGIAIVHASLDPKKGPLSKPSEAPLLLLPDELPDSGPGECGVKYPVCSDPDSDPIGGR